MLADRSSDSGVALRAGSTPIDTVVVGLHLRWLGVWQRPNHIISRLATRFEVLVIEEPRAAASDRNRHERLDGLSLIVPERRTPSEAVDDATIADLRASIEDRHPAFWLYTPMMLRLVEAAPRAPLIYDKMDELAAFAGADPRMRDREQELLGRASVVFAGGRSLWESVRERARSGGPFPSGVDAAHFVAQQPERAVAQTAGARFGYVGVLDERIDFDLIARLSRARPDATIELVGPVAKIDPASLPLARNIRYYGACSYAELPRILARFDVALMPFARNAATRFISPTKTLEYLAAGKPVVSTAVPDVVAHYADVVSIARGASAFVDAVARAERPNEARRALGIERARRNSWDTIVAGMLAACARANVL